MSKKDNEKTSQTEVVEKRPYGGRKALPKNLKRTKSVTFWVTQEKYNELEKQCYLNVFNDETQQYEEMKAFTVNKFVQQMIESDNDIRVSVESKNRAKLSTLDEIKAKLAATVSSNINQIAKNMNISAKSGTLTAQKYSEINEQLSLYIAQFDHLFATMLVDPVLEEENEKALLREVENAS